MQYLLNNVIYLIVVNVTSAFAFNLVSSKDVRSLLLSHASIPNSDNTRIPKTLFKSLQHDFESIPITYKSDFGEANEKYTCKQYLAMASEAHEACLDLFDSYDTSLMRCEQLGYDNSCQEYMLRWKATWQMSSSAWLYNFADLMGFNVIQAVPDSSSIVTFSWKNVFIVFAHAFETGNITLPIAQVEGSTRLKLTNDKITIEESYDLIREVDLSRLQNRKTAQEFASWLDVSRKPKGKSREDWEGIIRSRVLNNVVGTGVLDIDPNEDDQEGASAILVFGGMLILSLVFTYNIFLGEFGSKGQISSLCEDAPKLEIGSGYFSECFGPYGDGPFI